METTTMKSLVWLVTWSNSPIEPEVQQENWGVLSQQELQRKADFYSVSTHLSWVQPGANSIPANTHYFIQACVGLEQGEVRQINTWTVSLMFEMFVSHLSSVPESTGKGLTCSCNAVCGTITWLQGKAHGSYLAFLLNSQNAIFGISVFFFIFLFCVMEILYGLWKHAGFD